MSLSFNLLSRSSEMLYDMTDMPGNILSFRLFNQYKDNELQDKNVL